MYIGTKTNASTCALNVHSMCLKQHTTVHTHTLTDRLNVQNTNDANFIITCCCYWTWCWMSTLVRFRWLGCTCLQGTFYITLLVSDECWPLFNFRRLMASPCCSFHCPLSRNTLNQSLAQQSSSVTRSNALRSPSTKSLPCRKIHTGSDYIFIRRHLAWWPLQHRRY